MNDAWPTTTIGQSCTTTSGGTPSKQIEHYWRGDIPWVSAKDLKFDQISSAALHISRDALERSATKLAPVGSLLILVRGMGLANGVPIGEVVAPVAFNQDLRAIHPPSTLLPRFLLLAIRKSLMNGGTKDVLSAAAHGTLKIDADALGRIAFPVPPLPEQQRIVAILDEAFEGIATAKANAEKNLLNAQALPAIAMRQALDTGAVSWKESTIGDQITLQRGFDITKDQQRQGAVPVVSSGGIRSYHDTFKVRAPGVVMGRKGTLGKVFYLEEDFWPHDTTLWIKDFKGNDPRFVHRFFEVLDVQGLDSGAANPALNRNLVHPLRVLWPPLDEQVVLAERIGNLSARADQLALIYGAKLAALDELKKSLLHQAFSGAL